MSLNVSAPEITVMSFPRVSGDEPGWEDVADLSAMVFPA